MKLGVVITEKTLIAPALALMASAADRDFQLRCFLSDSGVKALHDADLQALITLGRVAMAVCEHSMERYGVHVPEKIKPRVVVGGQYQNAELVRWCDRVAVF
ncbi:MAG: DsrE family protein [Thiohalomonadaceae bacterium]